MITAVALGVVAVAFVILALIWRFEERISGKTAISLMAVALGCLVAVELLLGG